MGKDRAVGSCMEGALRGLLASQWVSSIPERSQVICSPGSWPLVDDTSPPIEDTTGVSRPRWSVLVFISQVGVGSQGARLPQLPCG